MKKNILVKTPQYEISLDDLCDNQYKKINHIMNMIENEFQTDMNLHQELKHEILDISNFIRRLPGMVSEVV
jgi:hypothetical protein|nr:MAG TPA: hypothetical protein [Caudoviricetes sp.]